MRLVSALPSPVPGSGAAPAWLSPVGTCLPSPLTGLLHLLGALENVVDAALHVERLLGDLVVFAVDDLPEAANRVREFDVLALEAGELLGDMERLRKELLDL